MLHAVAYSKHRFARAGAEALSAVETLRLAGRQEVALGLEKAN